MIELIFDIFHNQDMENFSSDEQEARGVPNEITPERKPENTIEVQPEKDGHYSDIALTYYLNSKLTPESEHRVAGHIKTCEVCKGKAGELHTQMWEDVKIPPGFK